MNLLDLGKLASPFGVVGRYEKGGGKMSLRTELNPEPNRVRAHLSRSHKTLFL